MSQTDVTIPCERREKVGSRSARRLRYEGRMVGCIQAEGEKPHIDIHFDAAEFATARRNHVHLFDLAIGGETHSAVINELQWDSLGDTLMHVEFKPVTRGVETESEVPIQFSGNALGVVQHTLDEVTIRSIPSKIPDSVLCKVEGLEEGTHILAKDLVLPEGVSLAVDPETEVAVIAGIKAEAVEPAEGEEEEPSQGTEG